MTLQILILKPLEMTARRLLRADLHVHTLPLAAVSGDLAFLRSRDCYSQPEDVYRVAKARGMDLVAITDHDSIDGCLELLDAHPDLRGLDRRRGGVLPDARRRHRSAISASTA